MTIKFSTFYLQNELFAFTKKKLNRNFQLIFLEESNIIIKLIYIILDQGTLKRHNILSVLVLIIFNLFITFVSKNGKSTVIDNQLQ